MAKKKESKKEKTNEHDENSCPNCGKNPKPVIDVFEGEFFSVYGNDVFMTITFNFNDVAITCPTDLWDNMRFDFQVLGLLPPPYSKTNGTIINGSIPPEELN